MIVLYILLAVVILLFMVLIHEFGHYIAGKILKFKIKEFSIGFGLPLYTHTSKKTGEKFSLRIFPLGGYCAFDGEDDAEESTSQSAFNNQKPWKRIIVFLAGVTANFLTAIIFSWILLCTIGYDVPQIVRYNTEFANPYQVGDIIKSIDGHKIDFAFGENYVNLMNEQKAKAKDFYEANGTENLYTFEMKVARNGQITPLKITVYQKAMTDTDGQPYTGYMTGLESAANEEPCTRAYVYNAWQGFCRSFEMAFGFAWVVLKSLWMLITFQVPITQVGGTFTTIATIANMASQSLSTLLVFIPLIAANLAVFNLLPFPALDGSHVLFTFIEWIRRKPVNRKVENIIHFVGLCILFGFVIIVDLIQLVLWLKK